MASYRAIGYLREELAPRYEKMFRETLKKAMRVPPNAKQITQQKVREARTACGASRNTSSECSCCLSKAMYITPAGQRIQQQKLALHVELAAKYVLQVSELKEFRWFLDCECFAGF